ncbi:tRNA pseudouridine synthase A [Clostridium pasteurianum DSM 525 = ATCC 6013]|uniref:tRNA pseudouridine synthase A n=1 Tax=Clostridium pasteurianum DSM 525 = ATCC 6013 TaxID=1262449 RepID=A0A0H3J8Y0_CLOPA|nr:tRNA pseudouridine(38-40) synthase TruA [Clostridium pasteurianum]AJA49697.1 tRNA pseudouridine synthase A [Clostridium pasteurianum DSM 525 = ATCC 6013]AJA53685.1 tRNA pseudouridine synthase A [Clostridium pasteurianum DSM 525 = ATCC 6013]AOZ76846.1 pseudouridine synthase [Clostridium pasteurianum DSM 525 = ATCC 6013]AOZ80643.1 pseudouridine synthase [Clostridium pasteurianum]ELP57613.1 tRNA pseudouridine synthase A [Clostridium pasteurianum DSM 525 = ATCC 6013]
MKNVKLIIEYDGTNYSGWQIQKNVITVEQVIEKSLNDITGENIKIIGSSRTDAGVHAKGFVGNFFTESKIPCDRFRNILNGKLPKDIVILNSEEVQLSFNSRFDSRGKTYSYTILSTPQRPAIGRNYVYHFRKNLDLGLILEASKEFIGTHDFAAFKSSGGNTKTTVRTISNLEIIKRDDYIIFTITGDGFLYNMVRIIIGTLIEVGLEKISPKNIKTILLSRNRNMAGPCVPPGGLCLEKVYY